MIFITQEADININYDACGLYFYTSWIPYHKKMVTMIEKVEQKYNDLKFFAIDADLFPTLCKRFRIGSVPITLILRNGLEVKRINGLVLTSAFKSTFSEILNKNEAKNGKRK